MKAVITVYDNEDNIIEKDRVLFPKKTETRIEGCGKNYIRVDTHTFEFFVSMMYPKEQTKEETDV